MEGKDAKIERVLSRNVEQVVDKKHIAEALRSGKKLRVKLGIDPTSPDLHLGHAVVLNKLREFQDLGCVAILLIGDFTAQIGDPSGRDKTRPPLTVAEVKENMRKYLEQAGKILDLKKAEIVYNSSWLGKLSSTDIMKLQSKVSLQQVIEREDFARRFSDHRSIQLHELSYPVLVAYDSVAVRADIEMGGADQLFNFLMGRSLMEKFEMKPQDILTTTLLVGTDGERKMSKSLGNYIGLGDAPNDMFGKVMSIPDTLMSIYFELGTGLDEREIKNALKRSPRDGKMTLAFEIAKRYHGEAAAKKAQENFEKTFSRHEVPEDAPKLKLPKKVSALDIVVASGVVKSKSEARRLIEQGGFEFNEKSIKNPFEVISVEGGESIRVGKKSFFRAIPK